MRTRPNQRKLLLVVTDDEIQQFQGIRSSDSSYLTISPVN